MVLQTCIRRCYTRMHELLAWGARLILRRKYFLWTDGDTCCPKLRLSRRARRTVSCICRDNVSYFIISPVIYRVIYKCRVSWFHVAQCLFLAFLLYHLIIEIVSSLRASGTSGEGWTDKCLDEGRLRQLCRLAQNGYSKSGCGVSPPSSFWHIVPHKKGFSIGV